jgi:predicted phosphodiesterase
VSRLGLLDRVSPPRRPWIFAVEDTTIQVTWPSLPVGPIRVRAADSEVEVDSDGGPGAVVLDGLPPGSDLELRIDGDAIPDRWRRQRFTTLLPPPGEELARFATISDMHVGEVTFGVSAALLEQPVPDEAHPVRATRAALDALAAWGAETVVVKGDLTHDGRAKDWDRIGQLLVDAPVRAEVLLGNHDHYGPLGEPVPSLALRPFGIDPVHRAAPISMPGLNLVLVDTTIPTAKPGAVAPVQAEVVELLRSSPLPAFLALHHHGERRAVPMFLPRGIPRHEMDAFVDAVRWARPATMITSGHTHRHRRRQVGSVVLTEVGSTKDFPGTWAGYAVHEGGIRQVVRRVDPPDLLRWTDHSARAAGGAWGIWAPGVRSHRCFSHTWPR